MIATQDQAGYGYGAQVRASADCRGLPKLYRSCGVEEESGKVCDIHLPASGEWPGDICQDNCRVECGECGQPPNEPELLYPGLNGRGEECDVYWNPCTDEWPIFRNCRAPGTDAPIEPGDAPPLALAPGTACYVCERDTLQPSRNPRVDCATADPCASPFRPRGGACIGAVGLTNSYCGATGIENANNPPVASAAGIYQDDAPEIHYSPGDWMRVPYLWTWGTPGYNVSSSVAGARLVFVFVGTGVVWHTLRSYYRGRAHVTIDGQRRTVTNHVPGWSEQTWYAEQNKHEFAGLSLGTHRLEIEVAGDGFVDMDYLEVQGGAVTLTRDVDELCPGACIYPQQDALGRVTCHKGNCQDPEQPCAPGLTENCGYVDGCSTGEEVDCPEGEGPTYIAQCDPENPVFWKNEGSECDWAKKQVYDYRWNGCLRDGEGDYQRLNYRTVPGLCGAPEGSGTGACAEDRAAVVAVTGDGSWQGKGCSEVQTYICERDMRVYPGDSVTRKALCGQDLTEVRVNTCRGEMTVDDLREELEAAHYGGPWDTAAMVAAFNFSACPPEVTAAAASPGTASPGTVVTLSATANNPAGVPVEWRWVLFAPGSGTAIEIRRWGSDPQATWNTAGLEPGNYKVQVWLRRRNATSEYESRREIAYPIRAAGTVPPPNTGGGDTASGGMGIMAGLVAAGLVAVVVSRSRAGTTPPRARVEV